MPPPVGPGAAAAAPARSWGHSTRRPVPPPRAPLLIPAAWEGGAARAAQPWGRCWPSSSARRWVSARGRARGVGRSGHLQGGGVRARDSRWPSRAAPHPPRSREVRFRSWERGARGAEVRGARAGGGRLGSASRLRAPNGGEKTRSQLFPEPRRLQCDTHSRGRGGGGGARSLGLGGRDRRDGDGREGAETRRTRVPRARLGDAVWSQGETETEMLERGEERTEWCEQGTGKLERPTGAERGGRETRLGLTMQNGAEKRKVWKGAERSQRA